MEGGKLFKWRGGKNTRVYGATVELRERKKAGRRRNEWKDEELHDCQIERK